ncbi:dephospho-CoA kinase [[Limnothrix rosea] IAM M-220]|uniref:dephospho-CoA kinase n=1 Tax=[Limnothrix rosea] IAM M-220 TaxID=454133 RepID=UPI0009592C3F|nr:dephospho-CoA kinase [[Limnothrix rosea] IAM M-220]OKH19582.1 dephospho-CoA kinase [[Limnothrix rosea] IAM M-220]
MPPSSLTTQRKIGLTGGIATGKSTVSNYLAAQYHYPILDADIYAREAVAIGSPILTAIFQRYGDDVKETDGTLRRQRLGQIIFQDLREKQWLEAQIHPFVKQRFQTELAQHLEATVICVIPLLIEAKLFDLVTETWVVTCSQTQQMQRLQQRNHLTETEAIARINSQLPLSEKVKFADVVLDNSSDLATLHHQVDLALKRCC